MLASDRPKVLILLVAALSLLGSCVGRGRYLETLLAQESSLSEAAAARTDLQDATLQLQLLREENAQLAQQNLNQQREAFSAQSGSLSERQALINERNVQALLVDSLRRDRTRLAAQRTEAVGILAYHASRLREVQARVVERAGAFLPGQLNLTRSDEALTLSINDATLFGDARGQSKISAAGDQGLAAMASALGGQTDITVTVVATPSDYSGTPASREAAALRASKIVSNLVEGHGLAPELVIASAAQTDVSTIALAPAEAPGQPTIDIVITIRGEHLGQLRGALGVEQ